MAAAWQQDDARFMARALELARRGSYTTDPNPRVGCVIVKDGQIVGEGWHHRAGEPHAEILALAQAADQARGATAYITLEPCCHHGRTPPCAPQLVAAGVQRVVTAMEDPHPAVAGQGHALLAAAGVEVQTGLMESEARRLNRGFLSRHERGRPFVTVKLACSIDGRTALKNGQSKWITGEAARTDVHRLRAAASAVITGIDSVLVDGARLNVRLSAEDLGIDGPVRQPVRVVLDSKLRLPPHATIFEEPGPVWIYHRGQAMDTAAAALLAEKATLLEAPWKAGVGLDLSFILKDLADRQINEVLVEAGPKLAGAFVAAGLVDELVLYQAPIMLGHEARPLLVLPTITRMTDRWAWRFVETRMVGQDLRITLVPERTP